MVDYQQTDTTAPAGAIQACSATAVGGGPGARLASAGGAAGSTPFAVGGGDFDTGMSQSLIMWEITPAAGTAWDSGNWTVRVNVTTAQASVTWTATYICRLNSSNVSQATIGSLTGQTTSMATTGVKSHTVSGASQTPAAGDKVYIVCVLTAAANNRTISITPNQLLTSPFTAGTIFPLLQTDNLGFDEPGLVARQYKFHPLPGDSLAPADALTRLAAALRRVSDNLGLAEAVELELISQGVLLIAVADSLALAEAFARQAAGNRSPVESLGVADASNRLASSHRSQSDTLGFADTFTRLAAGNRSFTDLLGLADALARQALHFRHVTDLAGLADLASLLLVTPGFISIAVSDILALADTSRRQVDAQRQLQELLGLTEALAVAGQHLIALAEVLGLADALTRQFNLARQLEDTLGAADQVNRIAAYLRQPTASLGVSESFARQSDALRQIADSLALAEVAEVFLAQIRPAGGIVARAYVYCPGAMKAEVVS